MKKQKIAVIMGGPSLENPISLKTGRNVVKYLDTQRFVVTEVVITREGLWNIDSQPSINAENAVARMKEMQIDCAFLALHGTFGEDGTIQALLNSAGIRHTGSDHHSSSLCFDKIFTKALLKYHALPVAEDIVFSAQENRPENFDSMAEAIEKDNGGPGYPCVVKTPRQGSSFGVFIAKSKDQFIKEIAAEPFPKKPVLVEEYIEGMETTCGVLESDKGEMSALPVTEIAPVSAEFFDFEAKYTPGATDEITPARISDELTRKIQKTAERVFEVTGCRGYARIDFFIHDNDITIIEVNTLPGLTKESLLPKEAEAAGISFSELLSRIIDAAR